MRLLVVNGCLGFLGITLHPIYLFGHKPYYAGGAKLTVQLRITADQTLFTEMDIMLLAQVVGRSIGMIDT